MSEMYYNIENQVMIDQSVNKFNTIFIFKIDKIPQEVGFLLDIAASFLNNLSPYVSEFLISEGVQVTRRLPTETNHYGNQRIILVRNAALKAEKINRTIKASVQPAGGSLYHQIFMRMPGKISSINPPGLSSSFQYEKKKIC